MANRLAAYHNHESRNPSRGEEAMNDREFVCRQAPIVHTYSIVARDAETGQMGVAVQSHYFAAGTVVTWAEAGVGAVATQSVADPAYGKLGLDLMRAGKSAPDALAGLLATDSSREIRQVAMVDNQGRVGSHTGSNTIP